jgi:hypothetical protein
MTLDIEGTNFKYSTASAIRSEGKCEGTEVWTKFGHIQDVFAPLRQLAKLEMERSQICTHESRGLL